MKICIIIVVLGFLYLGWLDFSGDIWEAVQRGIKNLK
jgi:hypothetical protein